MTEIIKEYEFSDLLPLEYLDEPHLQPLIDSGALEIKVLGNKGFMIKSRGCSGRLSIGEYDFLFLPLYGFTCLETLLPKALNLHKWSTDICLGKNDPISAIDQFIASYLTGYFENKLKREIRRDFVQNSVQNIWGSGRLEAHKSLLYLEHGVTAPHWMKSEMSREHSLNALCAGIYQNAGKILRVDLKTRSHMFSIAEQFASSRIDPTIENLENGLRVIDRRTEAYRELIEIAEIFLVYRSVGSGSAVNRSFLMKNWRIFEMAIRYTLRKMLGLQSEVKDRKEYCSSSSSKLEPDYVFFDKAKNIFIGDAKYVYNQTLELKIDHMYQMNAYMDGYGVRSSILFFPSKLITKVKLHRLGWGNSIHAACIPVCDSTAFDEGVADIVRQCRDPAIFSQLGSDW